MLAAKERSLISRLAKLFPRLLMLYNASKVAEPDDHGKVNCNESWPFESIIRFVYIVPE